MVFQQFAHVFFFLGGGGVLYFLARTYMYRWERFLAKPKEFVVKIYFTFKYAIIKHKIISLAAIFQCNPNSVTPATRTYNIPVPNGNPGANDPVYCVNQGPTGKKII